ncbi:hypothetical protein BV22DRAFT_1199795 [Leucogyrophana mollusca]|uniref:Uncharacterized protein n=1 Tax=Leucogyrophana mollusca TaxID=85980 RepID=A0ACB8AZC6_9AGAM|nr:hypothetical protein BV22DRAFT_1199795 [Leucogyrophana mollusca]
MGDCDSADNWHAGPEEGRPALYERTSTIEEAGQSQPCITKTVHTFPQEARDDSNGATMVAIAKGESTIAPPTQIRRDQPKQDNTEGIEGGWTFRVLTFDELRPTTELSHYELWKDGISHRDINESGLMYYRNAQGVAVGVLNDYDLASIIEGHQGNGRVGTMPFMAIELLDQEGPEGHITPKYHHVAESLIWVLAWVTLHYAHGTRLPRKDRPLEAWLSLRAYECGEKKTVFMVRRRQKIVPPPSQKQNWKVVLRSLKTLLAHYSQEENEDEDQDEDQDEHGHEPVALTVEQAFEKWLHHRVLRKSLRKGSINVSE